MACIILIRPEEMLNNERPMGWSGYWRLRGDHNISKVSKEPKSGENFDVGNPNPIQDL